jgi:hypothetical protein
LHQLVLRAKTIKAAMGAQRTHALKVRLKSTTSLVFLEGFLQRVPAGKIALLPVLIARHALSPTV